MRVAMSASRPGEKTNQMNLKHVGRMNSTRAQQKPLKSPKQLTFKYYSSPSAPRTSPGLRVTHRPSETSAHSE